MSRCVYLRDKTVIVSDADYETLKIKGIQEFGPIHGRTIMNDFNICLLDSTYFSNAKYWDPIGPEYASFKAKEVTEIDEKDLPTYSRMVTK